jgi:hypothetical protein
MNTGLLITILLIAGLTLTVTVEELGVRWWRARRAANSNSPTPSPQYTAAINAACQLTAPSPDARRLLDTRAIAEAELIIRTALPQYAPYYLDAETSR